MSESLDGRGPSEEVTPLDAATELAELRGRATALAAELQQARDQFQAVLDAVPGGVSWINADLEYLGINSRLASTFGLKPQNFIGQKIGFLQASPDFSSFVEAFLQSNEQNDSREVEMTIEGQQRTYLLMAQKYLLGQSAVFVGIDITDRKRLEQKLFQDAFFDRLTGLPNRALLMERMERALEYAKRRENYLFAVLFLDFDGFKHVNDSLGHVNGDKLLQIMAKRLQALVRTADTVARLGGDEFVFLLDDIESLADATQIAERVQRAMTVPFNLEGHDLVISVSVGITLSHSGYNDTTEMLRDADTAMYRAKMQGRNRYEIFDRKMHAEAIHRLQLESDLHRSLDSQEFLLHYQPIIEIASGRVKSFEALVRWERPERGFTWPGEFIGLAEETGLIVRLDRWVMRAACLEFRSWLKEFGDRAPECVQVNLSSRQFAQPDLVECVQDLLDETGLTPHQLKLEITESAIMENVDSATDLVKGLRSLGVRICIDDFGTGYSSLSYLHRLPLDTLKVDRSFIHQLTGNRIENLEIVRAIVMLAHTLHMDVVAEGIETKEQLELARELGCEFAQGHFYYTALSSQDVRRLLRGEADLAAVTS
jgi:diguanylate cyclase (GGDEF)-like protein/PAS domain S-box-containing protein